ncbi:MULTISPECIES: phytoene desaturase family protein [Anaerolinea]|nr:MULTISPECIES: NAD(P)-binding protein [Anaerolinea]
MKRKSVLIIGAGIAGLSAGIYAQMNGYSSHILEMHTMAGGLCTAWKRKGYTIDGCTHWLTGSNPRDPMYTWWQEIGLVQGRTFIDFDTFAVIEDEGGRAFHMYTDVERLERHMLDLFPQDTQAVKEFIQGVRLALEMPTPDSRKKGVSALLDGIRSGFWMLTHLGGL